MAGQRSPLHARRRPTIGLVGGWQLYERTTPNWFLEAVIRGVAAESSARGFDVLVSCGVGPQINDSTDVRPGWPVPGEPGDFVPVGPWNTDGLVFISPLRTTVRRQYALGLQQSGFPVVFIGSGDGRPAVIPDAAQGFRDALEHLLAHGHRSVAFLSGDPLDPGDSLTRLEEFRRLRAELGLDPSDDLVGAGLHTREGGRRAMRAILDTGHPFTAVLASNDMSAIGAIRALQERGRRVPEDVAVVGFDDQPGAAANVPPLASVDYPLSEAGRCAVEILDGIIRGGPPSPASVAVPTRLIRRRSCGCLHRDAGIDDVVGAGPGCDGSSSVVTAMVSALARAQPTLPPAAVLDLCRRLEGGLTESLSIHSPRPFESAVMELLQRVEGGGDRAQRWHAALTCLRRATHDRVPRSALLEAEDLFHLARVALSESADRQDSQHRLRDARQADLVSGLTVPLQSARDEGEIVALLTEHSPPLGLTPACFALYEPEAEDPVAWSRMRVFDPVTRAPSSTETRIETRCPWDERLAPSEAPRCLAVLPLVLKGHSMGFVAFEGAALAPGAAIVRQLAVALESARLQAAVREASLRDDLTGLHNRRFFTQELQREVARARRFGRTLALLLLDVDHFKAYNDTLGHRAGDEALQRIAELLRDAVPRRLDAAARYGGEEFVVLLAETDLEGARLVAERIRLAVQGSKRFRKPLTISAGIAVATGHSCDAESLLLRADTALYQAKADGRNCVRVAAAARVTEG